MLTSGKLFIKQIYNGFTIPLPWYTPPADGENCAGEEGDPPPRRETLRMMSGALKAALPVAGVFAVGMLTFLLFCVYVRFR